MKSHTDLIQSKKLAEILPLESADMWWLYVPSQGKHIAMMYEEPDPHYLARMEGYYGIKDAAIRCWSLAALLSVLPKYIGGSVLRMDMGENDFSLWFDDLSNIVDEILPDITKDNPVDACYEMITDLHKLKML